MQFDIWALTVRQPWAWMIVNGFKDVENRTWKVPYRGPLLIHAAKSMTTVEYQIAQRYAASRNVPLPPMAQFPQRGLVGIVTLKEIFGQRDQYRITLNSEWFEGPCGWHLTDPKPLPFMPCTGRLRLFVPQIAEEQEQIILDVLAGNVAVS